MALVKGTTQLWYPRSWHGALSGMRTGGAPIDRARARPPCLEGIVDRLWPFLHWLPKLKEGAIPRGMKRKGQPLARAGPVLCVTPVASEGRPTLPMLVDAVSCRCKGEELNLNWLTSARACQCPPPRDQVCAVHTQRPCRVHSLNM